MKDGRRKRIEAQDIKIRLWSTFLANDANVQLAHWPALTNPGTCRILKVRKSSRGGKRLGIERGYLWRYLCIDFFHFIYVNRSMQLDLNYINHQLHCGISSKPAGDIDVISRSERHCVSR